MEVLFEISHIPSFLQTFGAYCSRSWNERNSKERQVSRFFGTGESFVFRLSGADGDEIVKVSNRQIQEKLLKVFLLYSPASGSGLASGSEEKSQMSRSSTLRKCSWQRSKTGYR